MRKPLVVGVLAVALVACSGDQSVLERDFRVPDEEGVVTEASLERLVLDGDRTYTIAKDVESFNSKTHQVTQLLSHKDKYVHLGLNDANEVGWVAQIAVVAKVDPPFAVYTGVFEGVEDGRAVFADGTSLRLDDGVDAPEPGREVAVRIDPVRHLVVQIT